MQKACYKKMFWVFALLIIGASASAQVLVKGKVAEKDGTPVHKASISVFDTDNRIVNGTTTDIEGNFVLKNVNPKHKLTITNIGYKTITVPIGAKTDFSIVLEELRSDIGEVVIVSRPNTSNGLVNIPEKDLTTAVARINAKELEEMQAVSIDQALQGRLSGVDITASSGDPGAAMNIRIRRMFYPFFESLFCFFNIPFQTIATS